MKSWRTGKRLASPHAQFSRIFHHSGQPLLFRASRSFSTWSLLLDVPCFHKLYTTDSWLGWLLACTTNEVLVQEERKKEKTLELISQCLYSVTISVPGGKVSCYLMAVGGNRYFLIMRTKTPQRHREMSLRTKTENDSIHTRRTMWSPQPQPIIHVKLSCRKFGTSWFIGISWVKVEGTSFILRTWPSRSPFALSTLSCLRGQSSIGGVLWYRSGVAKSPYSHVCTCGKNIHALL